MGLKGSCAQDIHNSDVPQLCLSCEARHHGMCGALDAAQLVAFARHTKVVSLRIGDELLSEGSEIDSFGNIMRGVVKLTRTLANGRRQIVGLQFAPDFVGRLFADESAVTAEAASNVDICRISKPALEKLVAQNRDVERRLMRQALREIDEAREWMVTLGRKTASEKVASFLCLVATQLDPVRTARLIELPMTRGDIGDFLGLTIGTVSRELTKLRNEGLIATSGKRHVSIVDLDRLISRCG